MTTSLPTLRSGRAWLALVVVLGALLIPAGSAFAASDPTTSQYENVVTQVSGNAGGDGKSSGLEKSVVGGLPFTGLDLIALAVVAVALTSMGLALRRLTTGRAGPS